MGTWLVTGAAGFIGAHVAERLLRAGEDVVGVDTLEPSFGARLARARAARLAAYRGFRLEIADLAAPGVAEELVAATAPHTVVHLAARPGVRGSAAQPLAYTNANVLASVALLEACARSEIGHVVYASSSSVYGDGAAAAGAAPSADDRPLSLYAATKRTGELLAHSYSHLYGLPTTGLRLFSAYGPWGRPDMAYFSFAEAIVRGEDVPIFGDGSALRDYTFIDDVVAGLLAVAARPPGHAGIPWAVYDLGCGANHSVTRLVDLLEELLERPARRRRLPAVAADAPATLADPAPLEHATGFRPAVPLDEGLARFVAWFLDERRAADALHPSASAPRASAGPCAPDCPQRGRCGVCAARPAAAGAR